MFIRSLSRWVLESLLRGLTGSLRERRASKLLSHTGQLENRVMLASVLADPMESLAGKSNFGGLFSNGFASYYGFYNPAGGSLFGGGATPAGKPNYTGFTGTHLVGEDLDGTGNNVQYDLRWFGLNIAGLTNLRVGGDFASGSDTGNGPETADFIDMRVSIDGGAFTTVFSLRSDAALNGAFRVDSDLNGVGDGAKLNLTAQTLSSLLSGVTGTTMDLQLRMRVSDSGEEFGIDNIFVTGDTAVANSPPVVNDQSFSIDENSANTTAVGTVIASDPNAGQTLTYAITGGNTGGAFAINSTNGQITVANSASLDFETTPAFNLTVSVTDNGSPNLSDTAVVMINLNNVAELPEIVVEESSINVADGGSFDFGPVIQGATGISKTFVVRNSGTANLTLQAASFTSGTGFTITTNLTNGQILAPNASANLIVRLDSAILGAKTAVISFVNDDANENPFNFTITGQINPVPVPEIEVVDGVNNVADGGSVAFGTLLQGGTGISKTFVVRNTGTANLTLQAASFTSGTGFTITTNLTNGQVLAPNATANLIVRLDSATLGAKTGVISFVNDDGDENPFNFTISGQVNPVPVPEIEVVDGVSNVADDGSVAFGTLLQGATGITKTFVVRNTGTANLTLQAASFTSGTGFTITTNLTNGQVLAPNATANLIVRLDSATLGAKTAVLSFVNDDANENPFNFTITGQVNPVPVPEIEVADGVNNVADGGSVAFGTLIQGATGITKTFVVRNTGTANLTLQAASFTSGTGFTITTNLTNGQVLAPNATANLIVRLDSATLGAKTAVISFVNDDGDENPFNFTITGQVNPVPAPEIQVVVGASNVADGGSVTFGSLQQGATGISKTFVVRNIGTANLTLQAASFTSGTGFTITTNLTNGQVLAPNATTNLIVRLDSATLGAKTAVISFVNDDANENPFNFTITGQVNPVPVPEIEVVDGVNNVADGGSVAFGTLLQGAAGVTKTFVIRNTGTANLTLQAASFTSGTGFTITTNLTNGQVLAPNATANLIVQLDSTTLGAKTAVLSFVNDDGDENPFDLSLTGEVLEAVTFNVAAGILSVTGTSLNDTITVLNDAGVIKIDANGALIDTGLAAASVTSVSISGLGGSDTLKLDASLGALVVGTLLGGDGNDTLISGLGNDTLDGGADVDTVSYVQGVAGLSNAGVKVSLALSTVQTTGGAGKDKLLNAENLLGSNFNDTLTGNAGVNELRGGQGNDTLNGGGGADSLSGEQGNDLLNFDELDNVVSGGAGTDSATVSGALGAVILDMTLGEIEIASASTSIYANTLSAAGATWAVTITGGSGHDSIVGGLMNDRLTGGGGNDTIRGAGGNDSLTGGLGADRLYGDEDNDSLTIDSADLDVIGGTGIDSVTVNATSGTVNLDLTAGLIETVTATTSTAHNRFDATGATWAVNITGGAGNDTIIGGNLADKLTGGAGHDSLVGNGGNDSLTGGLGVDSLEGGADNDLLTIDGDDVTIMGGTGVDKVTVAAGSGVVHLYLVPSEIETVSATLSTANNVFDATGATWAVNITGGSGDETFLGGDMNDTLSGGGGLDELVGGKGNDSLTGGDGNDTLIGGEGNDTLIGGLGIDNLFGNDGNDALTIDSIDANAIGHTGLDKVTIAAGSGAVNFNLVANEIETVLATASTANNTFNATGATWAVNITGGSGNDTILGGNLNDTLTGGSGDDLLIGGLGDDRLTGGIGTDTISYQSATGPVTVNLSTKKTSGAAGIDTLATIENVIGSPFNDTITGDLLNNLLDGGDLTLGNDTILGAGGVDSIINA